MCQRNLRFSVPGDVIVIKKYRKIILLLFPEFELMITVIVKKTVITMITSHGIIIFYSISEFRSEKINETKF